jgi:hypothetical protein
VEHTGAVQHYVTLNVEGRRLSTTSTSEGRLRNVELESPAVPEVPTSCLPSWSNWLTKASYVSISLLTTSMSGATFVALDS